MGTNEEGSWISIDRRLVDEIWSYALCGNWLGIVRALEPALGQTTTWSQDPTSVEAAALLVEANLHLGRAPNKSLSEGIATALDVCRDLAYPQRLLVASVRASILAENGQPAAGMALIDSTRADMSHEPTDWRHEWTEILSDLVVAKCNAKLSRGAECRSIGARMAAAAQSSGLTVLAGDAFLTMAIGFGRERDYRSAQQAAAQAVEMYRRAGDFASEAAAAANRGFWLVTLGFLREANEVFSLSIAKATGSSASSLLLHRLKLGMAICQMRGGELEEAERLFSAALEGLQEVPAPADIPVALEPMVELALLRFRHSEARGLLKRIRTEYGSNLSARPELALELAINEAFLALAEGKYTEAASRAMHCAAQAGRRHWPWEQARALRIAGTALARAGKPEAALERFEKSLKIFRDLGEVLESEVVSVWIEAVGAALDGVAEAAILDRIDNTSGAVGFWLRHEVVGPREWLLKADIDSGATHSTSTLSTANFDLKRAARRMRRSLAGWEPSKVWWKLGYRTASRSCLLMLRDAERYARSAVPVLILGETGTGKELIARGLHELSARGGMFVPINCAANRGDVFQGVLQGVRRGAFADAKADRDGILHLADGGTLFLDEVADLKEQDQGLLLRFMDSGEVVRLGDTRSKEVRVRVISATNRPLERLADEGIFRSDMFNRLAGGILRLPPLRERIRDLPLLIEHLWEKEGGRSEWLPAFLDPDVICLLSVRPWGGNVRELRMAIMRAIAAIKDAEEQHRTDAVSVGLLEFVKSAGRMEPTAKYTKKALGPEELEAALRLAQGSPGLASELLGMSRQHFDRLKKQHGLATTAIL